MLVGVALGAPDPNSDTRPSRMGWLARPDLDDATGVREPRGLSCQNLPRPDADDGRAECSRKASACARGDRGECDDSVDAGVTMR